MSGNSYPSINQAINNLKGRYNWLAGMRGNVSTVQINAAQFDNPDAESRGIFIGSEWAERMTAIDEIASECLREIDAEIVAIREAIEKLGGTLDG